MSIVVTAPESFNASGFRVFLAGAIDMGEAERWQDKVISATQEMDNLVIINPRRSEFTSDTLDEQIRWELDALERCDMILMWLPSNSKAPISLFEAGLYWKSGKLFIGAGEGFYRRRNLEITGKRYGIYISNSLDKLIIQLRRAVNGD